MDRFLRISGKMISAVIYIAMIILPWIVELILYSYQSKESTEVMLISCGIGQSMLAIYLGTSLGISWAFVGCKSKISVEEQVRNNRYCDDIWCRCPTTYRSLFSTGHTTYFLPIWTFFNIMISWNVGSKGLTVQTNIMIYLPLIAFVLALFLGLGYQKGIEAEEQIKEIPSTVSIK